MKLYELTDKGRALLASQSRHEEPTNYGHCCSCCPVLEKRVEVLKDTIESLRQEIGDIKHE